MFTTTGKKIGRQLTRPRRQRFLRMEPLEDRRLLTLGGPLTYAVAETSGPSDLLLRRSGDDLEVVDAGNQTVLASRSIGATTGVLITGRDAANDSLTVDFSSGELSALPIEFHGGAAGFDVLSITGSGGQSGAYLPSGAKFGDGTFLVNSGTGTVPIRFTGLEPTTVSGLGSFTLTTPGSDDVLIIDSPAPGQNRISGISGGIAIESLTFFDITSFTLDMGVNDGALPDDTVALDASGLVATGLQNFTVTGGAGNDTLDVQTTSFATPGSGAFTFNGDAGTDTFQANADIGYTLTDTGVTSSAGGTIDLTSVENVVLMGGAGANTFAINTSTPSPYSEVVLDGGGADDTLDYSASTTQVAANLGLSVTGLSGALGEDQENPPTGSDATGTATVSNYDPIAKTFDITVTVTDLNPANVNGFHIHRGAVGVNGPIIIDLMALSSLTPVGTGFTFTATGVSLAASLLGGVANEASFLGGITYVNIHTTAFGGGEIRGQLFSTGNVNLNAVGGPGGTATGTTGITNIENVTGGTAADSLVGSFVANTLIGNGGNDTIVGGPGADTMQGNASQDVMVWSNGDGSDVMDGGSESDIVQVNGSLTANDDFAINAGPGGRIDFDRVSPGPFSLDIGTTEKLIVNGIVGDDTFTVNDLATVGGLSDLQLYGFEGADQFVFSALSGSYTTLVHGGPGMDELTGPDIAVGLTYNIDNPNAGSVSAVVNSFSFVENLVGGNGDDVFIPRPTGSLDGTIDGGASGVLGDLIDYDKPTAVSVNLGASAPSLVATLQADQEVPPNDSPATGTATVTYNSVAHTFDITVTVTGITPAELSGFHIHRQAFGVNGSIIVDFVPGGVPIAPLVPAGTGFTFTATGVPLDPVHEAALLGGITYVNVHTSGPGNFPNGEIRGQLFASGPFVAVPGTATGTAGIGNIERVNGGDGGDSIVGDFDVNDLVGAGGADVIVGAQGADTMNGQLGDDIFAWNNGDGTDMIDGGAAGVETDLVQVNGGLTTADTFAIAAGPAGRIDFDRVSPAPFSLDIGAVEQLFVNGIGGNDTFTVNSLVGVADLARVDLNGLDGSDVFQVTPHPTVVFNVDGDPVRPPTLPGDFLNVNTAGAGAPALSSTNSTLGKSGSYTFSDRAAVNFREIETLIALQADLSVTKTDSPDPVVAGSNLTYTITVTNNAAEAAANVMLTDIIPANTTFVSFTPAAGWTFTNSSASSVSSVTITNGGSGYTSAPTVNFVGGGGSGATGIATISGGAVTGVTITNGGSGYTSPPSVVFSGGGGTGAAATAVLGSASSVSSATITNGGSGYTSAPTVNFVGGGGSGATGIATISGGAVTGVTITNGGSGYTSPPSVVFSGGGGTGAAATAVLGSASSGTITATVATMAPGATATFTLVVNVNASTPNSASITNTADVSSATTDPTPGNNSDTETTAVIAQADLTVTKVDSPDPVLAGMNLTYTVTLSNVGASDAQTVQLTDAIPANTTFVSAMQTSGPAFTLMTPPVGGTGSFTATATTLAAGATATFTLVVNVNAGALGGSTITNTATASSTTTDPTPGNNSDTETTNVVLPSVDLAVTKTDSPDPVLAGTNLTYTVTVTNAGPSDAQTVQLTDAIPANTTFVSAMQTSGPAFTLMTPPAGGTGTVTATAATLAAGATATFTLVVNVNATALQGSTITNTSTVSSSTTDTNAANNSDTETTSVNAQADLSVVKVDTPDPVAAGANLTYTITVTNAGPGTAQNVLLTDAIPANTTFVAFTTPTGWTTATPPAGGTGAVTATQTTFAAGATATFTLIVNVNVGTPQAATINNTATVAGATTDPVGANNTDTETTTVTGTSAQVDVSVTKDDSPDPVEAGANLTYTITVTNAGPSAAQGVTLSDEIPVGTTFVSLVAPAGWTTTTPPVGVAGTVFATNPSVASGATDVFTLVVSVDATLPDGFLLSNTATVVVSSGDSNLANNSDTETTDVGTLGLPECEVITLNSPGTSGTATLEDDADNPGTGVLIVTGTAGNDVIVVEPRPGNRSQIRVLRNGRVIGTFNSADVQHIVAFGLAGNDKIIVNATLLQPATLFGDAGNDYLYGAKGADGLEGGSGVDRLFGGSGNDTLCGGEGNDFVYGQAGNDFAGGDAGNDKVFGEAGNDFLLGNDGNDFVFGGTGNDRMFGQAGNDQVFGEAGNDIGVGGDGNDKLFGGSGRDVLIGGDGLDTLFGEGQDDILVAGSTVHDEDDEALQAILAEWTSSNSYTTRVNNIRSGGGQNGVFTLDDTTVIDDGLKDTLWGNSGLDWFLFGDGDKLKDKAANELLN
jgi:uncharacterized repeat protein (TIGR01451 family)